MNKVRLIIGIAMGVMVGMNVMADDSLISFDTPLLNAFVNRGRTFQNETVLEPNVTFIKPVNGGSLTFNTWGNMGAETYANKGDSTFNEIDLTLSYSKNVGDFSLSGGLIEYVYSGQNIANTHEAYVSVTYLSYLNPSVSGYYDFKEANGLYTLFSISHVFNLTSNITASVDTGVGCATEEYNEFYFGVSNNALNDWNSGLTLTYSVTSRLNAYAGVRYMDILDSQIKNGAILYYGKGEVVTEKIGFIYTF